MTILEKSINPVIPRESRWERKESQGRVKKYLEITRGMISSEQLKEKIVWAIEQNQEEDYLDYKQSFNFKDQKQKLELVKDIVAIANSGGGYIVLGVKEDDRNSHGFKFHPIGLSDDEIKILDVANVKGFIANYVSIIPSLTVSQCKETFPMGNYTNVNLGIIYIDSVKADPIFFTKQGEYTKSTGKRNELVFRSGDLFIRKGTSSERIKYVEDWNKIKSLWRKTEIKQWQSEFLGIRELVERIDQLINVLNGVPYKKNTQKIGVASQEKTIKPKLLEYFISTNDFENKVLNWLYNENNIYIKLFLEDIPKIFFEKVSNSKDIDKTKDYELIPLLDNLTVFSTLCIRFDKKDYFILSKDILYKIYNKAFKESSDIKYWILKELIKRIYTIGAYSILKNNFNMTKIIIDQSVKDIHGYDDESDLLWIRYGLINLARAKWAEEKSLCKIAVEYVNNNEYFSVLFEKEQNKIINMCCQFDWLQCIFVISINKELKAAYPSFGIYDNKRTIPIISLLVKEKNIRNIFTSLSDKDFAEVIRTIDIYADEQYFVFANWLRGSWSKDIKSYLQENLQK